MKTTKLTEDFPDNHSADGGSVLNHKRKKPHKPLSSRRSRRLPVLALGLRGTEGLRGVPLAQTFFGHSDQLPQAGIAHPIAFHQQMG